MSSEHALQPATSNSIDLITVQGLHLMTDLHLKLSRCFAVQIRTKDGSLFEHS